MENKYPVVCEVGDPVMYTYSKIHSKSPGKRILGLIKELMQEDDGSTYYKVEWVENPDQTNSPISIEDIFSITRFRLEYFNYRDGKQDD